MAQKAQNWDRSPGAPTTVVDTGEPCFWAVFTELNLSWLLGVGYSFPSCF